MSCPQTNSRRAFQPWPAPPRPCRKFERERRDASYLAPPAQTRTCSLPAYGSHLGYPRPCCAVCRPAPGTLSIARVRCPMARPDACTGRAPTRIRAVSPSCHGHDIAKIAPATICGASPTRVTYETDGTYGQKQGGVRGGQPLGPPMRGGGIGTDRGRGGVGKARQGGGRSHIGALKLIRSGGSRISQSVGLANSHARFAMQSVGRAQLA